MSAREWKPGDKALVEVEVTELVFTSGRVLVEVRPVQRFGGSLAPVEALRPVPAAGRSEAEIKAEALREAAEAWTQGAWATDMPPKGADRPALILGMAQSAGDWLRARAARIAGTAEAGDES